MQKSFTFFDDAKSIQLHSLLTKFNQETSFNKLMLVGDCQVLTRAIKDLYLQHVTIDFMQEESVLSELLRNIYNNLNKITVITNIQSRFASMENSSREQIEYLLCACIDNIVANNDKIVIILNKPYVEFNLKDLKSRLSTFYYYNFD